MDTIDAADAAGALVVIDDLLFNPRPPLSVFRAPSFLSTPLSIIDS
jgi:hypothetical protein